jgi:hypothetical protein
MKKSSEIRRDNLLLAIARMGNATTLAAKAGVSSVYLSQIKNRVPESKTGKPKTMGDDVARKIEAALDEPEGWMDVQHKSVTALYELPDRQGEHAVREERRLASGDRRSHDSGVVEIPQYNAGGAMGHGLVLDGLAGVIKSWRVDHEWLRLNVRSHTGINNLCIVTGFGPSMRPMFNPGDPLLLDKGVNTFDHEDAIYFFRVDNYGFIKTVQRIPQPGGGMVYRAKSKNPDYDPFDITSGMDFEVFGKILTIWKSEQF